MGLGKNNCITPQESMHTAYLYETHRHTYMTHSHISLKVSKTEPNHQVQIHVTQCHPSIHMNELAQRAFDLFSVI